MPTIANIKRLTPAGATVADRSGQGMVGDAREAIMFGGYSTSAQNDFYRFAISGDNAHITLLTKAGDAISGRDGISMTGDATAGIIYGGSVGGGSTNLTNEFFRFVIANDTVTVTALTAAVTNFTARSQAGAIGDANSGIIFGGHTTTPVNDFYRYVVSGSTITLTSLTKIGTISGRVGFGIVGNASRGLIFGGWNNSGHLGDFIRYSVSGSNVTLTNLTISGTISPLYYMGMTGTDTVGVIFGGSSSGKSTFTDFRFPVENKFYRYAVSGNVVTITQVLNSGDIVSPRSHLSMVGDSHTGIIYGGWNGTTFQRLGGPFRYNLRDISIIIPSQNRATVTNLSSSGTQPSPNAQLSMAGTSTDSLMFGGSTSNTNFRNDFYRLVITSNTVNFTRLNVSGSIAGRSYPAMVGDSTNGVIFGGRDANAVFSDFNTFTRSGSALTVTPFAQTTIPARHNCGMVGDATTGIIYGGTSLTTGIAGVFNDFYRYTIGVSSVAITTLTKAGDAIVPRLSHGMVGSATAGAIYSGHPGSGGAYLTDFYTYSVSGNVVTLKKLTVIGDSRPGTLAFAMIGNETSGIIFGGWTGSVHLSTIYSYLVTGDYVYLKRLTTNSATTRSYFGYAGSASDFTIFGGYNNRWHRLRSPARYTIT